ncbi:DUF349 domain-containing protein [Lachnospiraceae bacterium]|nr:DUF349 domain-containing protein [Lachnospiraceae bacterium]
MSYNGVPNFNDPCAKIQERFHSQSGAKVIDVLYGAQNPDGTPKSPEKDDGHGHFSAIEIDGMYQMIMWRHPDSEGGYQEYGDYVEKKASRQDHPLTDLELEIKEKKSLLYEARTIMKERDYDTSSVDRLLERFANIFDMNTPVEQELKRKYHELVERNSRNKKYVQEQAHNAEQKRRLLSQAQELQSSEEWKATSAKMKELMEQWRKTGNAGSENDSLWADFQNARQTFYDRQNKHFEEMHKLQKERKTQKQEIISEARSVAAHSTDWNGTHKQLEEMLSKWKKVGSCGKDEDDRLWEEFQNIRNDFYDRRKEAWQKRESEFLERRQAKSALISEAQAYANAGDYSPEAGDKMRGMSQQWKEIGFCGKEYDEQLWSAFRMAQDVYWQGKKASGEARHREWVTKTKEAIERRRTRINKIQQNISNLKERMNTTSNPDKQNQIAGWISENEEQIREIEEEIYRMEREIS